MTRVAALCLLLFWPAPARPVDPQRELRVGRAGHAFDHLGNISFQAKAAAASGATIIYPSGVGAEGYSGLPPWSELQQKKQAAAVYLKGAKKSGIRLALAYLCATSMVKLESFDQHWPAAFRAVFQTPPSQWRQQGRNGEVLSSWYGGDYQAACMNHPDWRRYEKFMVRQQLESGHDGIFFDNPTVHPQGCYCPHCLERFSTLLAQEGVVLTNRSVGALREIARQQPAAFLRFRSTIARDFLAEMRVYARSLKSDALITCNNSLNSPEVFFSQARTYGYNIWEMSQAEDFVLVEDMGHQPRTTEDGRTFEYGPTYELVQAIAHGKPVVAATIAGNDYHTAPRLVRLAMAEAAAHQATYLSWPTWPEAERTRMIQIIRPQADFLRDHQKWFEASRNRADVLLFFPFRRWVESDQCRAAVLAAGLTTANIPYQVVSEDRLGSVLLKNRAGDRSPVLLIESTAVLNEAERAMVQRFTGEGGRTILGDDAGWLTKIEGGGLSLRLSGPATVRAVVRDQSKRTVVHLLNLNLRRISSFQDEVFPAENLRISCRVPFRKVQVVRSVSADSNSTRGRLPFSTRREGDSTWVELDIPRLEVSALLAIE